MQKSKKSNYIIEEKNKDTINYGELILNLRKKHKMTQAELGELVSLGKTAISNYETGYIIPSLPILEKIAAVFNLSIINFLMGKTEDINLTNGNMPRAAQAVADTVIPYIKEAQVKESILNANNYMSASLVLPRFMTEYDEGYVCVKMPDNSMTADNIYKNDYLIVKKSKIVENRQLVMALNNITGKYIVRRYIREGHIASLIPSSDSKEFSVMRIDERDEKFAVVGYVERVITLVK